MRKAGDFCLLNYGYLFIYLYIEMVKEDIFLLFGYRYDNVVDGRHNCKLSKDVKLTILAIMMQNTCTCRKFDKISKGTNYLGLGQTKYGYDHHDDLNMMT